MDDSEGGGDGPPAPVMMGEGEWKEAAGGDVEMDEAGEAEMGEAGEAEMDEQAGEEQEESEGEGEEEMDEEEEMEMDEEAPAAVSSRGRSCAPKRKWPEEERQQQRT